MTPEDINYISQIFAVVGVIASLVETLYYQYKNGTLDKKLFDAELNTLEWTVTENPGFLAWWAANPISLSAEFRAFIDGLIRDAQKETDSRP